MALQGEGDDMVIDDGYCRWFPRMYQALLCPAEAGTCVRGMPWGMVCSPSA